MFFWICLSNLLIVRCMFFNVAFFVSSILWILSLSCTDADELFNFLLTCCSLRSFRCSLSRSKTVINVMLKCWQNCISFSWSGSSLLLTSRSVPYGFAFFYCWVQMYESRNLSMKPSTSTYSYEYFYFVLSFEFCKSLLSRFKFSIE